jgi:tetratricopeptide (TPR) repeat protein
MAHRYQGTAYHHMRMYDKSEEAYSRSIEVIQGLLKVQPENSPYRRYLGRILLENAKLFADVGQNEEFLAAATDSFEEFRKAVDQNPNDVSSVFRLVQSYRLLEEALSRLARQAETDSHTQAMTRTLRRANDLCKNPITPITICQSLSIRAFKNELRDWAVEIGLNNIRNQPDNKDAWGTLGMAYYRAGRHEESIQALNKYLELADEDDGPPVHLWLAMAYSKNGKAELAQHNYELAIELLDGQTPGELTEIYRRECEQTLKIPTK